MDRLFGAIQTPHALILGEPGSGKTTALHKLLHAAREGGGANAGGTGAGVPLWMRRFTSARDNRPISAWIQDELDERLVARYWSWARRCGLALLCSPTA
ncbi:MAG: ATP-binding protein [Nannocystis sp.]|nr:ATP-binding protein [Nannocystis sp.]